MLILVGYIVVIGCILVGYLITGGYLGALYQPAEVLIIAGAAVGAFIVSNSMTTIKMTLRALKGLFIPSKYNKKYYMDLIALMFMFLTKMRKQGNLAIETDIDSPQDSELFTNYPNILADNAVTEFITDYMRLVINGNMPAHELEALMDEEIETYSHELESSASAISNIGDGLPAFGIVAAVMGVVNTLAQADRPAAELGELIAHAMVGTFLGILLAYGFVSPLAALLRLRNQDSEKCFHCLKAIIIASVNGAVPQNSIEFGRKVLHSSERPSFFELEEYIKQVRNLSKQDDNPE